MLTKLIIRNFKRFENVEIPLSSPVVFIGPNNSGKTTALQAFALWDLGLRRWKEKRGAGAPEKRPGVNINRRDLFVSGSEAKQLWRKLHVRDIQKSNGKQETKNIRIDILVGGNTNGKEWECGLEFDFWNDETFVCRPLRMSEGRQPERTPIPEEAYDVEIAFLPPMSNVSSTETRLDSGAINVRLGDGRTAEVLRNLCYALSGKKDDKGDASDWAKLVSHMQELFKVKLDIPEYIPERGEIQMTYRDEYDVKLDLTCSGLGLQQTLLLLAYLALHPGAVLLLDEPDAHLEILRQREIYLKLRESARESGSQLIVASHSEEVLNQAASMDDGSVVAFLGKPHRIPSNSTTAVKKALNSVRYDQYYLAEQVGWVLYLEDHTDLSILKAFAEKLNHPAVNALQKAFLVPIGNQPKDGRKHFYALIEAKPDLVGFLLVDSDAPDLQQAPKLTEMKWESREIENYICQPATLESFAREIGAQVAGGPLLEGASIEAAVAAMREAVRDRVIPAALRNLNDPWWKTIKASDEFLDLVFPDFYKRIGQYMEMRKADYYRLVPHVPDDMIPDEIRVVLDKIAEVAANARPVTG
jgi:energy-coupling factor transporter ATP-binding protein EcfA2